MTPALRSERPFAKRAGLRHACDHAAVLLAETSGRDPADSALLPEDHGCEAIEMPNAHSPITHISNDRAVFENAVQASGGQEPGPLFADGAEESSTAPAIHACVEKPR